VSDKNVESPGERYCITVNQAPRGMYQLLSYNHAPGRVIWCWTQKN